MARTNRKQRPSADRRGSDLPIPAVLTALLLGAAAVMALIMLNAEDAEPAPSRDAPVRERTAQRDGLALGSPGAPVTIDVYADFQCPYCGRFALEVAPRLEEAYVNTGKARLVYHHYAFLGTESSRAAEAAYCAADQGRFWEYHDKLFANQAGENRGAFREDRLTQFAGEIGLDPEQFNRCLASSAHRAQVQAEGEQARAIGVRSTPTVFINGRRIEGLSPYRVYQGVIEEELSR